MDPRCAFTPAGVKPRTPGPRRARQTDKVFLLLFLQKKKTLSSLVGNTMMLQRTKPLRSLKAPAYTANARLSRDSHAYAGPGHPVARHTIGSSAGRLFQLKYFAPACGPADRYTPLPPWSLGQARCVLSP